MYKCYKVVEPDVYYYYDGNNVQDITLIIFLMDVLLIGFYLKKFIFGNRLYYINNNKLKNYNTVSKENIICKKIIKDIEYNDFNYKFNLNILKKNIYNIHGSIPLSLILNLYKNIHINDNSTLHIKYFKNDTKILKILSTSKFEDILN